MPGIDIAPLASYLPLVDKNVTEKYRLDSRGVIPIALVIGEHKVSAGIDETFKTDFQLALSSKDNDRLQDLLDADPSQYNCATLLFINSLGMQMESQTQGITDTGERAIHRNKLSKDAKEMIKSMPNGEKLIKDVLIRNCRNMAPTTSSFLDKYNKGSARILNNDKIREKVNLDVGQLTSEQFLKIESEILTSHDVINRLAYWKATIMSLLEDNSSLRVGALGMRQGAYVDYPSIKSRKPADGVLRTALATKLQMVNYINEYGVVN